VHTQSLAHLSDLHLGRSEAARRAASLLCDRLVESAIDHVVVTGDVTHRGRAAEWAQFLDVFSPLLEEGRMTIVPGNHDRLGDDVAHLIMDERRVDVVRRAGLHLVRVDSTAPHNRFLVAGHGALCDRVIADCAEALADAAPDALRVVLLHHHVLPAPVETFPERLADLVALPFANELALGGCLLERLLGHADLVLHGHRHKPCAIQIAPPGLPGLGVYNAGSSIELGAARIFRHAGGALVAPAAWLHTTEAPHVDPLLSPLVGHGARPRALPRTARDARRASA